MSRESKIVNGEYWGAEQTIYHYESFGWELLSLNGKQITMSRETQNPVYPDLIKHQAKYEKLEEDYKKVINPPKPQPPTKFSFGTCFILLLLAVIPGAIYITYKVLKNKKYKEEMALYNDGVAKCNKKRAEILAQIKQTVMDSRATFFSKQ